MFRVATGARNPDAVEMIGRDQVARVADRPADLVARPVDEHPLRPVAAVEVGTRVGRDEADLIPLDHVARGADVDLHSLEAVAADDVVLLGIAAADGRVVGAQEHPLLGVSLRRPARHCPGDGELDPVSGSTG